MFQRILTGIVAFLLTILPWSPSVRYTHQTLTYPGAKEVAIQTFEAIEKNDIDYFKNLLSETTRNKLDNIDQRLENFVTFFNDKEIIRTQFLGTMSQSVRPLYTHETVEVKYYTSDKKVYRIWVGYTVADGYTPENVGIDKLVIYDITTDFHDQCYNLYNDLSV